MTTTQTQIKHVYGNKFSLAIPLNQIVRTLVDGQEVETESPFYPKSDSPVMVVLAGCIKTYKYEAVMVDNVATITDLTGQMEVGMYNVSVLCQDQQGNPCRFMVRCAVQIVSATKDAGIEAGIEFDATTYTLDGAVFFYAKGDKGDPGFTEEEAQAMRDEFASDQTARTEAFTESQNARTAAFNSAESQRQSTFNNNESSRASAESARVSAEASRVSAESSRVLAESGRVSAEALRVAAETSREEAERGRVTAENARVVADEQRDQAISNISSKVDNVEIAEQANSDDIDAIEGKIPSAASSSNQLADKNYVNSAIATAAADFKGTYNTLADLEAVTGVNANDYGYVVSTDSLGNKSYARYKYVEGTGWVYEYTIANPIFTQSEWDAINSGLSSTDKTTIDSLADASDVASLPKPSGAADIATMQEMLDDAVEAVSGAEKVNCELLGSVVRITDRTGLKRSIDLQPTNERVQIEVSTLVSGVSVSGLVINVYYNDSMTIATTVTTDANGMAALTVPANYKYKLIFPDIAGCNPIPPVVHVASLSERSVEIEYTPVAPTGGMQLTVYAATANATGQPGTTAIANMDFNVTMDGTTTVYTTGSDGKCLITIPYNKSVSIQAPIQQGYELRGSATRSFVANQSAKYVEFIYTPATAGLYIVTDDATEYTQEEFEDALEAETVSASDAKLIKVVTNELTANGGVFYVSIDMLATRSGIVSKKWANRYEQFYDIPLNGNSATANYYYDGKTASSRIQDEGDRQNNDTPAVDEALAKTFELTARTLHGFLGSTGQWAILWANRYIVDDLILLTRPSATYNFSSYTAAKWTSTQNNANTAFNWTSSANFYNKFNSSAVVTFFAY